MEVREGYKKTEIGVIPEEWECLLLEDVGDSIIGLTYKPSDVKSYGKLVLRSSNIDDNKLVFTDNVYVDMQINEKLIVQENDILVCVRNGSRNLIGKCAIIDKKTAGQTFGAFMSVFRSEYGRYLFNCFQSNIVKNQIKNNLGATINQITNHNLNSFYIPLPKSKTEQQAISTAISDIDGLISSLTKLIDKKKNIKQGAMQELLNPKEDWACKKLGEVGCFSKGIGITREQSQSGNLPCIRYGEIYTRHNDFINKYYSFISREVAKTSKRIKMGDILFAGSGETKEEIGKCVAFTKNEEAYVGGDIIILSPQNVDSLFLGYYLNTPKIVKQKASKGQGDAVVHISSSNLASIIINLPALSEQHRIATIFSDMDAEIAGMETKLSKYKAIKQGMMQELLTGRIRLVEKAME